MAVTDTTLMQQWRDAKSRHPDALVFFRVGDFYETFYEDAEEGARLLGLTLTSRNNGAAAVPLAGGGTRADEYLERLVRVGTTRVARFARRRALHIFRGPFPDSQPPSAVPKCCVAPRIRMVDAESIPFTRKFVVES